MEYAADNALELCDGQWHTVKAWKDKTIVKLQVDGGDILEGGGKGSQTDANIYDPLYVGGLPGQYTRDLYFNVTGLLSLCLPHGSQSRFYLFVLLYSSKRVRELTSFNSRFYLVFKFHVLSPTPMRSSHFYMAFSFHMQSLIPGRSY